MSPPADSNCNTWLRKRLLDEYPIQLALESEKLLPILAQKLSNLYGEVDLVESSHYVCFCVSVPWQQQAGPSCGVSVLNMADACVKGRSSSLKEVGENLSLCKECANNGMPENIKKPEPGLSALRTALKLGVSSDGELFCAYNFLLVGEIALGFHTAVQSEWDVSVTIGEILEGYPLLVPYDRSLSDHRPGKFQGSKAHWCIIAGFVIPISENRTSESGELTNTIDFPNILSTLSLVPDKLIFKERYSDEMSKLNENIILICEGLYLKKVL